MVFARIYIMAHGSNETLETAFPPGMQRNLFRADVRGLLTQHPKCMLSNCCRSRGAAPLPFFCLRSGTKLASTSQVTAHGRGLQKGRCEFQIVQDQNAGWRGLALMWAIPGNVYMYKL